jgi:2-C-methyl-D-erythritol 4-phosphate cytidylyltransferase
VPAAARPLATPDLYERVIAAVRDGAPAAIPGIAVSDTVKVVADGVVTATLDRDSLVAVQTPQAFRADVLRAAHADQGGSTDDAGLVEALGFPVVVVAGETTNRKITHPDDLEWARAQLAAR